MTTTPHPTHPTPDAPRKGRRWAKRLITPTVGVTALLIGVGIGLTDESTDSTAEAAPEPAPTATATVTATPSPAPTVTETATPEPAPTVTETPEPEVITEEVEVQVVPTACLTALDEADKLIDVYSEAMIIAADSLEAAMMYDAARLDGYTARLGDMNDNELTPALMGFYLNEEACRDAG